MWYKIDQLKLNSAEYGNDIDSRLSSVLSSLFKIPPGEFQNLKILSRNTDARHRSPQILYNLIFQSTARLNLDGSQGFLQEIDTARKKILLDTDPDLPEASPALQNPVIVGTGPCGIFAALALALRGCNPVVIDRGFPIPKRNQDYQNFLKTRVLNPESNLLVGEGGAGTYSDGKLYTGTRSSRSAFILKTFADAGAPEEITYLRHPHIGSDYLGTVAVNLRKRIQEAGGTFLFGTEITDILVSNRKCTGVLTSSGEKIQAPAVLIAAGLGGRNISHNLRRHGLDCQLKGFQIGSRIEHPQEMIDRQQYHCRKRPASLGAAEYHILSRGQAGDLPVCSFCMCPGGEVVMASGWENQLVSNGMSNHARSGKFANSALIVTLSPDKFSSPEEAYSLLENLERKAFCLGGKDYSFPAQDAAAFLRREKALKNHESSANTGIVPARLDELFPTAMNQSLNTALKFFDRQYPGFIKNGKFIGIESCISSPVRFLRQENTLASSCENLWLGGEGAGCAGGIMSAAIDGLKLAAAMMNTIR